MKRFPFTKIRTFLEDFDITFKNANYGGCAVVASILAKNLLPHVDDLKIVCTHTWYDTTLNIDSVRDKVKDNTVHSWNSVGIAFNHVWVEFKWNNRWYAVDSEGLRSRRALYSNWSKPFVGSFTLKEINQLAMSPSGWNSTFKRKQIPHMRKFAKRQISSAFIAA